MANADWTLLTPRPYDTSKVQQNPKFFNIMVFRDFLEKKIGKVESLTMLPHLPVPRYLFIHERYLLQAPEHCYPFAN